MPYNPGVQNRAGEYIMRGAEIASQAMARGISEIQERRDREQELDQIGAYFLRNDPEGFRRFQKGSYADKVGAVRTFGIQEEQQQRNLNNQLRAEDINTRYYGIDTEANIARERMQHDVDRFGAELKASTPQPIDLGGGQKGYYTPRTGNIMRSRTPLPAPGGREEIPVYDGPGNTGNVVAKRVWDPIKGAYDTVDVRARASNTDALGALLGGGSNGGTKAPAAGSGGTQQPSIPALPRVNTKAERDALPAGTQYIGPDGKTYTKK